MPEECEWKRVEVELVSGRSRGVLLGENVLANCRAVFGEGKGIVRSPSSRRSLRRGGVVSTPACLLGEN